MIHSIIIPWRSSGDGTPLAGGRYLRPCIDSIFLSASNCGILRANFEIVLSDRKATVFNKAQLLNDGVEYANGDVLTFIDADSIVGSAFMESVNALIDDPAMTKLCYRVRKCDDITKDHAKLFAAYDSFPLAGEAYGAPHNLRSGRKSESEAVYGNSHFSITREKLANVRWDESFLDGRMEDVEMNRRIAAYHGPAYKATIVTDPSHAILTLDHGRNPAWNATQTHRNNATYWQRWNDYNARNLQS